MDTNVCNAGLWAVRGKGTRRPVIACFGDSHTQGMYGTCWVNLLREKKYPQYVFLNCGINGEVLESIRRRVEPTLLRQKDVVGVVVLGGTNDCLANLNPSTRRMIAVHNPFLPRLPGIQEYGPTMELLLESVHRRFPRAQVAWVTLPVLGEELDSRQNELVNKVNQTIKDTVAKYRGGFVRVIDLNEAMRRYLVEHALSKPPRAFKPEFFTMAVRSWAGILSDFFLFKTWNSVSDSRGLCLLNDDVHLNERSAALLMDLLCPYFDGLLAEGRGDSLLSEVAEGLRMPENVEGVRVAQKLRELVVSSEGRVYAPADSA